ncbi:MAG TPA: hypothetical protein VGL23_20300, partial [Chloroflexota bacterium]
MTLLFAAALLAVAFGAIAAPLVRPARRAPPGNGHAPDAAADVLERRERVYADLRDLELDRGLGTVGQDDYEELRRRYRADAIALLRTFGASPTAGSGRPPTDAELAEEIERQVAARRARPPAAPPNGTVRRPAGAGRARPRPRRRWAIATGGAALASVLAIAYLYQAGQARLGDQPPLSILPAGAGPIAFAGGAALAASPAGLLVSPDGGRSWRAAGPSGPVRALAGAPEARLAFAVVGDGLLRSDDGGATWLPRAGDLPAGRVRALAAVADGAVVYAALDGGALLRSDDGGAAWRTLSRSLPDDVADLAVQDGAPRVLFAASPGRGVLRSTTEGTTWEAASGAANMALDGAARRLAVAPRRGGLFAGTDRGLFRSDRLGGEWRRLSYRGDVAAVSVDPGGA